MNLKQKSIIEPVSLFKEHIIGVGTISELCDRMANVSVQPLSYHNDEIQMVVDDKDCIELACLQVNVRNGKVTSIKSFHEDEHGQYMALTGNDLLTMSNHSELHHLVQQLLIKWWEQRNKETANQVMLLQEFVTGLPKSHSN